MSKLTSNQLTQLNMYSVYTEPPEQKLFTLETLIGEHTSDALNAIQIISGSPNKTVTASYFMRRLGMFTAMQFYNLAAYDEVWQGNKSSLIFGAKKEFGNLAVSTFAHADDWQEVSESNRQDVIRHILLNECADVILQIRSVSSVSSLTLWENIFGFLLWQYHVLLSDPGTADAARVDLDLLKSDAVWEGIATRSLFAAYLNGREPSALLNTQVRKTCCFSKDVPGLMQCGFCPLK